MGNDHLLTRTFLVGERISLADIVVCCTLLSVYKQVLDPAFRKPFVNVNRWFLTVVNQPNVKAVIGDFPYAPKWQSLMPRSMPNFQERGIRKKSNQRRKNLLPKRSLQKRKIRKKSNQRRKNLLPKRSLQK